MEKIFKQITLVALVATGLSTTTVAQEIGFGAKFGVGAVVNDPGTQNRANINMAFTASYGIGLKSDLFAELGYRSFRASEREVTPLGQVGYAPGGATGIITRTTSVDIRKDNLEGFTLNLGFRRQIADSPFRWHAGVAVVSFKSRQDVTGMITIGSYREGLAATPSKTSVRPGLFAGIQYRVSENFYIESNLGMMGYQKVNYVPFTYTGQPAHIETVKENKVVLDLNCGFRF